MIRYIVKLILLLLKYLQILKKVDVFMWIFFLYFGNLFYFDWLKNIYMVICDELIWYCL